VSEPVTTPLSEWLAQVIADGRGQAPDSTVLRSDQDVASYLLELLSADDCPVRLVARVSPDAEVRSLKAEIEVWKGLYQQAVGGGR